MQDTLHLELELLNPRDEPWVEQILARWPSGIVHLALRDGEDVLIGRKRTADIRILETCGKNHARLLRRGATVLVIDHGTTNGTWLNHEKVYEPTPLADNQELGFSNVFFRVRFPT